jgi:hypothetical protein
VIDIDQLDAQLEQALTDELRMLRGVPPRTATTPATPPATPPVVAAPTFAAPPPPPARPAPPPPPVRFTAAPDPLGFEKPASPPPPAPTPRPRQPAPVATTSARDALRTAAAMVGTRSVVAEDEASRVTALLAQGKVPEAEAILAQGMAPASLRAGWTVMRAILQGREADARNGLSAVRAAGSDEAVWSQRLWIALTFGGEDEQYDVLELCRERAYRYDDLAWRGALTLVLARLGRTDEAARELATTAGRLDVVRAENRADVVTNLAEAAFLLGDHRHADALAPVLARIAEPVVVVGQSWVCKGSLARYRALASATAGRGREADHQFDVAAGTHRAMGAGPLLSRTDWERAQLRLTHAS